MYKAIIFDLDGTLLDTSPDICKTVNEALAHFGCPPITLEQTIKFIGNGAKKLIERAVPPEFSRHTQEIYLLYLKLFAACDNNLTSLYDGEKQFLERLSSGDIKTAIVTNKPDDATKNVCKKYLGDFRFDYIIGQKVGAPLKPDPSATLALMDSWGVMPSECVFVGDGETDVMTAKNAGTDCISVLWGYRPQSALKEVGADVFALNYTDLSNMIFKV